MVVRKSKPASRPFDELYAKVRAGDPPTSVHAFLRVMPAIRRIKERVIAIYLEKALADIGKPWQERGLTDYELQCRAGNHGSSYRTRRDELVYDERVIVFAGFQRRIGQKLCNVWRLREPGDPFYVPAPRDGVPGKPRRKSKTEVWLCGRGVSMMFDDRKAVDAFLKHWRFFPVSDGEGQVSFRDREDWVARFTPGPGPIHLEMRNEPYEPTGIPVVDYDPEAAAAEPRLSASAAHAAEPMPVPGAAEEPVAADRPSPALAVHTSTETELSGVATAPAARDAAGACRESPATVKPLGRERIGERSGRQRTRARGPLGVATEQEEGPSGHLLEKARREQKGSRPPGRRPDPMHP